MSTCSILWLYDDLLDLYGDSGNLTILTAHLKELGITPTLTRRSISDALDFAPHQMVYIGPGKAKNLARAAQHFQQYAAAVHTAVESGVLFFVTGNARLLFGRTFQGEDGTLYPGVGLFPYTGRESGNVFISDVISTPVFAPSQPCYGFINRTAQIDGNDADPLFSVLRGATDNEQESVPNAPTPFFEGNLKHHFFGTWQLGPILVKNPQLLREVLRRLTGDAFRETDCTMEQKALDVTLREFSL